MYVVLFIVLDNVLIVTGIIFIFTYQLYSIKMTIFLVFDIIVLIYNIIFYNIILYLLRGY